MSLNVTQCPACESTFNTNSRVLAAAAGKVRCGACLNVFEAIDHFLMPEAAQDQDESVFVGNNPQEYFDPASFLTRSALNEKASSENISKESEQTASADEQHLHQALEQSEAVSEEFFTTVAQELQETTEEPDQEQLSENEEQLIDQADEPQASIDNESPDEEFEDAILDSFKTEAADTHEFAENKADNETEPRLAADEDTHSQNTESSIGTGLSASFSFNPYSQQETRIKEPESGIEIETEANDSPEQEATSEQPIESEPSATETATEVTTTDSTFAASNETPEPLEPPTNNESSNSYSELASDAIDTANTSIVDSEEASLETAQQSAPETDEDTTEAIRSRALETELNDEEALETIPPENLAALGSMSTPVELLARKESRLLRSSLLALSILLLSGLLAFQYLWQRMELYSQLAQLRPFYEVVCTYLNCTLPEYADIDSIRSENLVVQTHPSSANSLVVSTVIRNTAAFKQAFPILILSFDSVENSTIALREFAPAEYLDLGLRSIETMPANTPVQISLAIMDPGPEAVNYTLAFRWP